MQKTPVSSNHGLVLFDPWIGPLSGATTSSLSGPGSDGNKGVLCIPQSSCITGTTPSDCLVSYPGHSLVGSYSSTEKQSVYSTAPADWTIKTVNLNKIYNLKSFSNFKYFPDHFNSRRKLRSVINPTMENLTGTQLFPWRPKLLSSLLNG